MLLEWQYVQAKYTFVFKQFWTKSTQEANIFFLLLFFLIILTSVTLKEKKEDLYS